MKKFLVQKLDKTVLAVVNADSIATALQKYCKAVALKTDNMYTINPNCIEFTICCISYTICETDAIEL